MASGRCAAGALRDDPETDQHPSARVHTKPGARTNLEEAQWFAWNSWMFHSFSLEVSSARVRLASPGSANDPLTPARTRMIQQWNAFLREADLDEAQERQLMLALADAQREYKAFESDWVQFGRDAHKAPETEVAADYRNLDTAAVTRLQQDMNAALLARVHKFLDPTQVGLLSFYGSSDVVVVGGLGLFETNASR